MLATFLWFQPTPPKTSNSLENHGNLLVCGSFGGVWGCWAFGAQFGLLHGNARKLYETDALTFRCEFCTEMHGKFRKSRPSIFTIVSRKWSFARKRTEMHGNWDFCTEMHGNSEFCTEMHGNAWKFRKIRLWPTHVFLFFKSHHFSRFWPDLRSLNLFHFSFSFGDFLQVQQDSGIFSGKSNITWPPEEMPEFCCIWRKSPDLDNKSRII